MQPTPSGATIHTLNTSPHCQQACGQGAVITLHDSLQTTNHSIIPDRVLSSVHYALTKSDSSVHDHYGKKSETHGDWSTLDYTAPIMTTMQPRASLTLSGHSKVPILKHNHMGADIQVLGNEQGAVHTKHESLQNKYLTAPNR